MTNSISNCNIWTVITISIYSVLRLACHHGICFGYYTFNDLIRELEVLRLTVVAAGMHLQASTVLHVSLRVIRVNRLKMTMFSVNKVRQSIKNPSNICGKV